MTSFYKNIQWNLIDENISQQSTDMHAVETMLLPPRGAKTTLPIHIYEICVKHPNGNDYSMSFMSLNCSPPKPGDAQFEYLVSKIIKRLKLMLSDNYPTQDVSYSKKVIVQESFKTICKKTTIDMRYIKKRSLFFWFLQYGTEVFDYFLVRTNKAILANDGTINTNQYNISKIIWIFQCPTKEVIRKINWLSDYLPIYQLYRKVSIYTEYSQDYERETVRYQSRYFWLPKHDTVEYSKSGFEGMKSVYFEKYLFMILQWKSQQEEPLPFLSIEIIKNIMKYIPSHEIVKIFDALTKEELKKLMNFIGDSKDDIHLELFIFYTTINNPIAFYQAKATVEYNKYISKDDNDTKLITQQLLSNYDLQKLILIKKSNFLEEL
jgi:hypothetical protein